MSEDVPTNLVHDANGTPTTTSLAVAEYFGKEHFHILRAIDALHASKNGCISEFAQTHFLKNEYVDAHGRPKPMYHMTKSGFEEGVDFTVPKFMDSRSRGQLTIDYHITQTGEQLPSGAK